MSEHTKEPWAIHNSKNLIAILDYEGKHLAELWQRKEYDSVANARRIVACVNACAGIPTEALEQITSGELCEVYFDRWETD
jgi:hypothetical protein